MSVIRSLAFIDGKPVRFADDAAVLQRLSEVREGKRVLFTVRRGDRTLRITILPRRMSDQQFLAWQKNMEVARMRSQRH